MTRILLTCGLVLALAGAAQAAEKTYVARSLTEPASRGLARCGRF